MCSNFLKTITLCHDYITCKYGNHTEIFISESPHGVYKVVLICIYTLHIFLYYLTHDGK